MNDLEQKAIFSKNLNRYLSLNNKTQKEVAEAINVSPQTFNTWCQGIALPRMGKVQRLADYFGIGKSDLIDDKTSFEGSSILNEKDNKDIARDLDTILEKLSNNEYGPASYDGEEIPDADREMFAAQLEIMLRRLKTINKEKYNPNKNKK